MYANKQQQMSANYNSYYLLTLSTTMSDTTDPEALPHPVSPDQLDELD